MQKAVLILSGFACLLFIVFALVAYESKTRADDLSVQLATERAMRESLQADLNSAVTKREEIVAEVEKRFLKSEERTALLEQSIDPKNFRWAKIKSIREAVSDRHRFANIIDLTRYASSVYDYSEEYDVPIPLILAVTRQESAFNPKAVSHAGAKGLMQLMPATAKECADDTGRRYFNIFRIQDNVRFGTWYLWKMMDRFNGDVGLAVRAYNCGPTCVEKVVAGEWSNYPEETRGYVEKVLEYRHEYENLGL